MFIMEVRDVFKNYSAYYWMTAIVIALSSVSIFADDADAQRRRRQRYHDPAQVIVLAEGRPRWVCVPESDPPVFGHGGRITRRGMRVKPKPRAKNAAVRQSTRLGRKIERITAKLERLIQNDAGPRRIARLRRNIERFTNKRGQALAIISYADSCEFLSKGADACNITSNQQTISLAEGDIVEFSLNAQSDCSYPLHFDLIDTPAFGQITLQSNGNGTFKPGYNQGDTTATYRACHIASEAPAEVCSEEFSLQFFVTAGGNFIGDENSLAPYRSGISLAEKEHLIWKVASNRQDLLSGAEPLTLSEFVLDRLMGEDSTATDLIPTLEEMRSRSLTYPKPIRSEHFIPDAWKDFRRDTSEEDPKPVIPADYTFNSAEDVDHIFQRLVTTSTRSHHSGNWRYHWGAAGLTSHLFLRSRYLSPVHEKMMRFWFGHFGTSNALISGGDEHYNGYFIQNIERNALGSFKTMMLGSTPSGCPETTSDIHYPIICDATSQIWLDNQQNIVSREPNENFGREFMELYVLSPIDEWTGRPNYTDERDVQGMTVFMSGFTQRNLPLYSGVNIRQYRFDPAQHFPTKHDVFSEWTTEAPNLALTQTNLTPKEAAAHIIDNHPGSARYIAGKIFSSLVYPDPDDALVYELGELLKSPEVDWHIGKFVSILLQSEAMFSKRAAERNCVESPAQVFLRAINGLQIPLLNMKNYQTRELLYTSTSPTHSISAAVFWAGERILDFPSVFSYGYCGRSVGVDGSSDWLKSYLNIFKVQGFVHLLNSLQSKFNGDYDFAEIRELIAPDAEASSITPLAVVLFFEKSFQLTLSAEERAVLLQYLTTQHNGSQWIPTTWSPENDTFMRRKFAGMIAIMAGFQQVWL